ncbi:MAG TPA: hypothetical protein VGY54_05775, partial [Polyangiaceae bacterium]|nr:hypothetical protein [Polyangiaceae bacterium]
AGDGLFAGFVALLGGFLAAVFFGADFACVFVFNFFLEPAMVAISDPGSLADPRDYRDEKCHRLGNFRVAWTRGPRRRSSPSARPTR